MFVINMKANVTHGAQMVMEKLNETTLLSQRPVSSLR